MIQGTRKLLLCENKPGGITYLPFFFFHFGERVELPLKYTFLYAFKMITLDSCKCRMHTQLFCVCVFVWACVRVRGKLTVLISGPPVDIHRPKSFWSESRHPPKDHNSEEIQKRKNKHCSASATTGPQCSNHRAWLTLVWELITCIGNNVHVIPNKLHTSMLCQLHGNFKSMPHDSKKCFC